MMKTSYIFIILFLLDRTVVKYFIVPAMTKRYLILEKKKFCSCRTAAVQHPVKCQFIRHSLLKALVGITRMNIDCEQIVSIGLRVSIIMLKVYKRKACKGKKYIDDFKSQSFVSHRTCVLYCHAI